MNEFNYDVRAGFAHVLELVGKGVGEMYSIEPERIDANDPTISLELPAGAANLLAIVFGVSAVLLEFDDARATRLLSEMVKTIMPFVMQADDSGAEEGEAN